MHLRLIYILPLILSMGVACISSEPVSSVTLSPTASVISVATNLPATSLPTQPPSTATPLPSPMATVNPSRLTHTPTIAPTPTATPIVFSPTFAEWLAPTELPGLLGRYGGFISAFAVGSDNLVWLQIGQELVGIDMVSNAQLTLVGHTRIPFMAKDLYWIDDFIIGVSDQLFLVDISEVNSPQVHGIISDLGQFSWQQAQDGALFIRDEGRQWWQLHPKADIVNMFTAVESGPTPVSKRHVDNLLQTAVTDPDFMVQLGDTGERLFVLAWEEQRVLVDDVIYFIVPTMTSNAFIAVDASDPLALRVINVLESFSPQPVSILANGLVTGFGSGASEGGFTVIDWQQSEAPQLVGTLPIGNQNHVIDGQFLYMASHPGLFVYDLSNLHDIREIASAESPRAANSIANQLIVYKHPQRPFLFLVNGTYPGEEKNIEIVDLIVRERPQFIGQIETNHIAAIAAHDGILYVLENHALRLFDITKPASPEEVTRYMVTSGDELVVHYQGGLTVDRLPDGRLLATVVTSEALVLLDVGDAESVSEIGRYPISPEACPPSTDKLPNYTFQRLGSLMYGRVNDCHIQVIDMVEPSQPELLDTLPFSDHFLIADDYLYVEHLGRLELYDLAALMGAEAR